MAPPFRLLSGILGVLFLFLACSPASETSAPSLTTEPALSSMPPSPVTDRLVGCMSEAGWEVSRSWQGGIESGIIPQEQLGAYNQAMEACSESSGWSTIGHVSAEQKEELYRQEVANHQCLTGLGVESAEPPTHQTYVATYQTAEQYYSFLPGFDSLDQRAMEEAVAQCPPPTWFMNISELED